MLRSFRNAFFTGLFTLLPLGITAFVVALLIERIGTPASKLFFGHAPRTFAVNAAVTYTINILATLLVVVLVALLGCVSRYFLGRWIIGGTERIIGRLPFVRMLYNTSKQIIGTFSDGKRAVFRKAVLVEFPNDKMRSIGFVTGKAEGHIAEGFNEEDVLCVFIPTTPNPTSGFLILVPSARCVFLDLPIADAMKMVISGGAFIPVKEKDLEQAE
ncbi:MAG: DUF502 domain-containing protein [Puniceicoccales bacterium]|jgi:uncharacterized membrane protein|nr:DUF502 domain-containing protein [Puniceicoccales bacterium]